jgi:hypothetical protein
MAQVPVTRKEIVINPDFVSKLDAKLFSNDLGKLIGNGNSELGTDANKLGELTPDIAVQIQNPPQLKDHYSFDPHKTVPNIWRSRLS